MTSALFATYNRFDLAIDRAEGAFVYADDGRRYLDFGAGIAVNGLGHCHPHLVAALEHQAHRLWHCSNLYRIPEQERLARRLVDLSFADAAFFCNSGAEAIECTIKLVRKGFDDKGEPHRYRIITFEGAFHGRTLATIAAGGSPAYLNGFEPALQGFDRVPFGDLDAVSRAIGPETAAILVEPIQGEGGIRPAPAGFLAGLRDLADTHGLKLCFDEVQCGIGRTGRMFAHECSGVEPDVMALAKGLGGGFPVAACLARADAAAALTPGSHGSTFGGNPLAMAVANAVLDVMQLPGFLDHVHDLGSHLKNRLDDLAHRYPDIIAEVRGLGLMLGLRCGGVAARTVVERLMQGGLLAIPAGDNVVRLLPPLVIGAAEADLAMAILDQACADLAEKAA